MLLTLTTPGPSGSPATDLGFLLHKHPDRVQSFEIMAGTAQVFYPRADEHECTVALLLEIDPVELVRHSRRHDPGGFLLGQYVNDRPYVASSLLAVALGKVFRTALNGRCDSRPELVERPLPLRVHLPAVPGAAELAERLFGPLGWRVDARTLTDPDWGHCGPMTLTLTGEAVLSEALNQLYVLLPVLDDAKHYWVAGEEVHKLLRAGGAWLGTHPEQELVTQRYLAHVRPLVNDALARLADPDSSTEPADSERPLAAERVKSVVDKLRAAGARRVVDLGCGDGRLLRALLEEPAFSEIVGVDVSTGALAAAKRRLGLDRLPQRQRQRITMRQSALTYTDSRLCGYDAAALVEVIEHLDPHRLSAAEHAVFGHARPDTVLVTTPNAEYNERYSLGGGFRHPDHRFEWDRPRFAAWAERVGSRFGYTAEFSGVGEHDAELGHPTQLATFTRSPSP